MSDSETRDAFREKWSKNPNLIFASTLDETSSIQKWILERNGYANVSELRDFLKDKKRILDAGCGNGRVTALLAREAPKAEIWGVDFSSAEVAAKNLACYPNVVIREKDLLAEVADLGTFDFIYSQEVLHHTADPRRAFGNLASLLRPGGEIAIYIYKLKAPVREFTDELLRQKMAGMTYEQSMAVSRAITEIGRQLEAIKQDITVATVEELGIQGGTYSVQRFVYHFFMKCFWNDENSFEDNAVINYDWYRPQIATRHTRDEVRGWLLENNLSIEHEFVDEYGITMRGRRPRGIAA